MFFLEKKYFSKNMQLDAVPAKRVQHLSESVSRTLSQTFPFLPFLFAHSNIQWIASELDPAEIAVSF